MAAVTPRHEFVVGESAVTPSPSQQQWLLVSVSFDEPGAAASLHAWRRLRALGAHPLQPAVYLLPERAATMGAVARLAAYLVPHGGLVRTFGIASPEAETAEETDRVAGFCAARSHEYGEVAARASDMSAGIARERDRGLPTYGRLEDLHIAVEGLRQRLASIVARDHFGAPGRDDADAAVEDCRRVLSEFEHAAFAAEAAAVSSRDSLEAAR